jgi:tRNA threonylcarbamoyl adenosine modification protein YjeE
MAFGAADGYLAIMYEATIELADEAATRALGALIGGALSPGDVIALSGPLGAGKSCLARAAIAERTEEDHAPSPTFGLVHSYPVRNASPDFSIWHFDLYRLEKPEDVRELGLEEALDQGASLIEWPERIAHLLPDSTLLVRLALSGDHRRAQLLGNNDWRDRLAGLNSSSSSGIA